MLTGFGGGIVRDAIMGDVPYLLKHGSNYVLTAFWGSMIFYTLSFVNVNLAMIVSFITTLYLREVVSGFGLYNKVIKNNKNGK